MALKRFNIGQYGHGKYGQLELNNVFFRREGAIEAQCALDPEKFATEGNEGVDNKIYAENGMILAVDKANGIVTLPGEDTTLPLALNYSTEHMYDERKKNLGSYYLPAGTFYPRMGYLKNGEIFTTNCLCYDDEEFTTQDVLVSALEKVGSDDPLFGVASNMGAIKLTNVPGEDPLKTRLILKVVKYYTMPDGTPGIKFQVIASL